MATKDKKSQLRIDPAIAKAIAVIAKSEGVPGYEMLELICVKWILDNRPELRFMIDKVIDEGSIKKGKD